MDRGRGRGQFCVWLCALICGAAVANPVPFTEEALARGLDYSAIFTEAFGYGVGLVDLDQDGDADVVALGRSDGIIGIFENDGTANFTDRSATSGIPIMPRPSGVSAADYDGDGDLDLFVSCWMEGDRLLRNDGGFVFTDVTLEAGLGDVGAGTGSSWGDFDGDGWIDLHLSNRTGAHEGGTEPADEPNRLYRNRGDGSFDEQLSATGLAGERLTFQSIFLDYDRDGDADLYISNDKCETANRNRMWRNDGGSWTDVTDVAGTGVCQNSMGVAVGDFDGDGYFDLYPTNTPEGNPLFIGQANGTFQEIAGVAQVESFAIGWGARFVDFDNDGWRELYVANILAPNRLYDHDGQWPASDLAPALGVAGLDNSYGIASADLDLDGDHDLVVSNAPGPLRLYINHEGSQRSWTRLKVAGRDNDPFGIGAIVEVRTGARWQVDEVRAGASYKSQNEIPLHFGLDDATMVDEVVTTWPGGTTRTQRNLPVDTAFTLYPPERLGDADGDGDVDRLDLVAFVACKTTPAPGNLQPGCEMMDFDGNGNVFGPAELNAFNQRYSGPATDCDGDLLSDVQELFDGTQLDLDANGVPDDCEIVPADVGGLQADALIVERGVGVELSWSDSCLTADYDYAVYAGRIGDWNAHRPLTCSTSGATNWSADPDPDSQFFLVAPLNEVREGVHGLDGAGSPRLRGLAPCLPEAAPTCDP